MNEQKERLRRINRLVEIRQLYVTAAEARVREAEYQVRLKEAAAAERDGQIRQAQEDIAYLERCTGGSMQNRERFIFGLYVRARQAREALDNARKVLESRRREWSETMRDQKVIQKVQERRLLEWRQGVDIAEQKNIDAMTVARHARNFTDHESNSPDRGRDDSSARNAK